jgi:hypothetical protein
MWLREMPRIDVGQMLRAFDLPDVHEMQYRGCDKREKGGLYGVVFRDADGNKHGVYAFEFVPGKLLAIGPYGQKRFRSKEEMREFLSSAVNQKRGNEHGS